MLHMSWPLCMCTSKNVAHLAVFIKNRLLKTSYIQKGKHYVYGNKNV